MTNKKFKVKYIGQDRVSIRNGDVYEAYNIRDDDRYYGVVDLTGEDYAYPKKLFEVVE